jgi:hypothetical protein
MPRLLALLALLALGGPALGQPTLLQQFISPDPVPESRFASGVALSGDYVVIGEPGDLGAVGRAFVFVRDPGSDAWAFDAELIPTSLVEGGEFDPAYGSAVAFDGPNAIVGAPYESGEAINSGAAFLFRQDEVTLDWVNFPKLKAPTPALQDQFGFAVSISGATVAVGAPTADEAAEDAGAVYLYTEDIESGTWQFDQVVTAADSEAGNRFGFALDLAADVLVVGVSNEIGADDPGGVYVFEREGDGPWTQIQKLVPDDVEEGDNYGFDVATDGETIFIGAPLSAPLQQGSAYVYERVGTGDAPWQLAQRLISNAPQENAQFGAAVAVDNERAVVGAPLDGTQVSSGAAYTFERTNGVWAPEARLSVPLDDENASFGLTLDLQSDLTLVGSPGADGVLDENAGTAFVFSLLSTAAEDAAAPDAFGLAAPFPNPARSTTAISYTLDAPADIALVAYDLLGREVGVVARGPRAAGTHTARWTAAGLPPGLYVLRLTDGDRVATRKLLLLR